MPRVDQPAAAKPLAARQDIPKTLRPYLVHGLNLDYGGGVEQALADCPFCGREQKLSVAVETGLWRCLVCAAGSEKGGGNIYTFFRLLWDISDKATTDYSELAANRELLYPETLMHWGVVASALTHVWMVPGYGIDGKIKQLYRYEGSPGGKKNLYVTSETNHQLHGVNKLFNSSKGDIYLTEGCWDAMSLWEVMRGAKRVESDIEDGASSLAVTGSEASSLLADANVIATPGCNVFREDWAPLFAGKRVFLLFDNDHPAQNGTAAGHDGMKRVAQMLAEATELPASIHYLHWSEAETGNHNSDLASGFDVRDLLTAGGSSIEGRLGQLEALLDMLKPIPTDWIAGRSKAEKAGGVEITPLECKDWETVQMAWRRAMKWTEGLDRALSVLFAAVISTETLGEQIWVMLTSPASSGKTTLCEALAVAKKHIHCRSTLREVYSGYKVDAGGKEDFSIIPHIANKTLIVKDGDTLLKNPNRGVILAQYRDLYDGVGRSQFNNGTSRNYERVRFTFILAGTASLCEMDAAEVGARFISCSIMDEIDVHFEREVNMRVVHRAFRNVRQLCNSDARTHLDTAMVAAKQLTAGYVNYLRTNAETLLGEIEVDDAMAERVVQLGELVALLRARPPRSQNEVVEREFSPRLVEQFARLAVCLAAVLGKKCIDEDVLQRVRKVALDTSRGKSLELTRYLLSSREGAETKAIALLVNDSVEKTEGLLRFLKKIGVVELHSSTSVSGLVSRPRWRITARVVQLYSEAISTEVKT